MVLTKLVNDQLGLVAYHTLSLGARVYLAHCLSSGATALVDFPHHLQLGRQLIKFTKEVWCLLVCIASVLPLRYFSPVESTLVAPSATVNHWSPHPTDH